MGNFSNGKKLTNKTIGSGNHRVQLNLNTSLVKWLQVRLLSMTSWVRFRGQKKSFSIKNFTTAATVSELRPLDANRLTLT